MWLLLVVYLINALDAHPQCLDFRAPFQPQGTLPICEQYQSFGCCGPFAAWRLSEEVRRLIELSYSLSLPRECWTYVADLICQKCSPYAAHIYDVEATRSEPPVFPGLCRPYCMDLYHTCSPLLSSFAPNQNLTSELRSAEAFCDYVKASDEDYCYPDLLTNRVLNGQTTQNQTTKEDCLCLEEFPSGPLSVPLIFRHAGDGSKRVFIGERNGIIHVYLANGQKVRQPFLNLSSAVLTTNSPGDERGLLGLAFHPEFKNNGRFYVHYSVSENSLEFIRISEFLVADNEENRADHSSERRLLQVRQPYWNHNGGELIFGDDGYLYISLGDGGSSGDPNGFAQNSYVYFCSRIPCILFGDDGYLYISVGDGGSDDSKETVFAQDKQVLLGKILRIDVDSTTDDLPYGIPPDNPYNGTDGRPEIFAYGLRNVWRCGKDRGDKKGQNKGRILCGDVGQSNYEEIDIIQKGGNYGWNAREGVACYKNDICGRIGEEIFPIHSYHHKEGKSVIGGHVYRGCLNPNLQGLYIYGDHVSGRVFRLREEHGAWSAAAITMCGNDVCMNGLVGQYPPNINTFGEDEYGEIFMVSFKASWPSMNQNTGKVYRLVDPRRRGNPDTCIPARNTLANLLNATSTANYYQRPENSTFSPVIPGRGNLASGAMATGQAPISVTMVMSLLLTGSRIFGRS